jgi:hypothetical protein
MKKGVPRTNKKVVKHLTIDKEKFDKVKLEDSYNNHPLDSSGNNNPIGVKEEFKNALKAREIKGRAIFTNGPIEFADLEKLREINTMVSEIMQKELSAADVLYDVIKHIHGTYSDKYQSDVTDWLDTKALLLSKGGKVANVHSASKYIQRYSTIGFEKSENTIDLLKAIHYIMIEIQRARIHKK